MEEKNLTPQESMAVITSMIEATKKRVAMPIYEYRSCGPY